MTDKRFIIIGDENLEFIMQDRLLLPIYGDNERLSLKTCCELLNELHEEKEDWKHNCLITVSENSILWNEISILIEQGAEPSDAFKNYLNDLKNKNKRLQGD